MAARIASGETMMQPAEEGLLKAFTYGVTAKVLGRLALPSVDDVMAKRPTDVNQVTQEVGNLLEARISTLLMDDFELESELNEATESRFMASHGFSITQPGFSNLNAGINSAMIIEGVTLGTIQDKLCKGESITYDGLIKSKRVPFAFAMQTLAQFDLESEDLFTYAELPGFNRYNLSRRIKVFHDDAVSFLPTQGISLTKELPKVDRTPEFAGEPTVGCPATLVKNFVRDLHTVTAESCVEAGIITTV